MSQETIANIHKAIQAHIEDISLERDEENGHDSCCSKRLVDDFVILYETMNACTESGDGIAYSAGYVCHANSTPRSAIGLTHMGMKILEHDLTGGRFQ